MFLVYQSSHEVEHFFKALVHEFNALFLCNVVQIHHGGAGTVAAGLKAAVIKLDTLVTSGISHFCGHV